MRTPQFNESFIMSYNEESNKGYFLEIDVKYPERLHDFIMIYHFYLSEWKLNSKSLLLVYMIKLNMSLT